MNTVGPVPVEDYLTNVATPAELEKFKKLIAEREKALGKYKYTPPEIHDDLKDLGRRCG